MMRALAKFRLPRLLGRLGRDRRGVSAVEFALIAPVMVTIYLGAVEMSEGVSIDRKVSLTASTLANLAAQVTSITTSDMTNILDASTAIVAPYDATKLSMSLSCISFDANKNMTVKWTALRGTTTQPTISVSDALKIANTQLLYAEVHYTYTPIVGNTLTGNLNLSDRMFMAPRISAPTYGSTSCTS